MRKPKSFLYTKHIHKNVIKNMKVVERKNVRAVGVRITISVPAWVIKELEFEPGDNREWIPLEDDNGERMVALRRIKKGEKKEGKKG